MYRTLSKLRTLAATAALLAAATLSQAATFNFSNLETALADPSDMMSMKMSLWTGWATQMYEYNMPFIELRNESDAPFAIDTFSMTIGDTGYNFSNIYLRKEDTNSYPYPANGEYAITGFSTPDIEFTTSTENNGDLLVVDFTNGLQPGEVVRFQVDIDRDDASGKVFAPYTTVFFTPNGGADTTGNSLLTLTYEGTDQISTVTLPNYDVSDGVLGQLTAPRPYDQMQVIDVFPEIPIDQVPEPTTCLLAATALAAASRRRV